MFFLCSRQKIELPLMENVQTVPPPYVVRTVLIYSHHVGQLQFNPSEAFSVSMKTPENQEKKILKSSICYIFTNINILVNVNCGESVWN